MAVNIDGHTIDVVVNRLSGKEHVHFDGDDVSSKRTMSGTTHTFSAAGAEWEVDTKTSLMSGSEVAVVRRDGTAVYPSSG